jgi:hypothetical protein
MDIIRIPRTAKVRHPMNQRVTQREQERVNKRLRFCASEIVRVEDALQRAFGRVTMSLLQQVAESCTTLTNGFLKPDRLARRHRPAMLCFFCENWLLICQLITQHNLMSRMTQPEAPDPEPVSITALLNRAPVTPLP